MTAATAPVEPLPSRSGRPREVSWSDIATRAPRMARTMQSYLARLGIRLAPRSVDAAEVSLRLFAGRVTYADPNCRSAAAITTDHVADYVTWLTARPGRDARRPASANTVRHRLGLLRVFFE